MSYNEQVMNRGPLFVQIAISILRHASKCLAWIRYCDPPSQLVEVCPPHQHSLLLLFMTNDFAHLPQSVMHPRSGNEGLVLKAVIGYNGNGRGNMIWKPDTGNGRRLLSLYPRCPAVRLTVGPDLALSGLFAYTCGCVVVVEDLHTGAQRHWLGHSEEVSCLAVTNDAQVHLPFSYAVCVFEDTTILTPAVTPTCRLWPRRQQEPVDPAVSFASGTFVMMSGEIPYPTTRGRCRASRSPGMTCSSSPSVSFEMFLVTNIKSLAF